MPDSAGVARFSIEARTLNAEGVTDDSFSAVTADDGSTLEGREAVAGYETPSSAAALKEGAENPFMPKMPQRGKNKGTAPEPKK